MPWWVGLVLLFAGIATGMPLGVVVYWWLTFHDTNPKGGK